MIHKRNSLRRAIVEFKQGKGRQPEQGFIECEEAFEGAYKSYRIDGRSRMDVDTFFHRGELIDFTEVPFMMYVDFEVIF